MLATVDIDHPKLQNYTKEEFETILSDLAYSYLNNEDDGIDGKFYLVDDDKVPEDVKKMAEELDKMTDEEIEKEYFSI